MGVNFNIVGRDDSARRDMLVIKIKQNRGNLSFATNVRLHTQVRPYSANKTKIKYDYVSRTA